MFLVKLRQRIEVICFTAETQAKLVISLQNKVALAMQHS